MIICINPVSECYRNISHLKGIFLVCACIKLKGNYTQKMNISQIFHRPQKYSPVQGFSKVVCLDFAFGIELE